MQNKPLNSANLAYTVGEPAGIGVDIILQLASETALRDVVCIGDRNNLQHRARQLKLSIEFLEAKSSVASANQLRVWHTPITHPEVCRLPNTDNVPGVLTMLDRAVDGCVSGEFLGMVTGPLHKAIINDALSVDEPLVFSGHTEYIAQRTKTSMPVMMLATDQLRVALVTSHLPLKAVSEAITDERIKQVCRVIHRDLQTKFNISNPKMLVCGLNPHAGEGGHLGREEIDTIIPALDALRVEGLDVVGPLPADTLFTERYLNDADVAVAMYHDQGLPVLKSTGFGAASNITLGLPICRTSVDHGTAFDLAGSGQANINSLKTAIAIARQLSPSVNPIDLSI